MTENKEPRQKRKMLDIGCGMGGWTIPLMYDGWDCTGIDIDPKVRYPAKFILGDISKLKGKDFRGFDAIFLSLPCNEFSIAKERSINNHPKTVKRDIQKGLDLIAAGDAFVQWAKPKFYVMENVTELADYWNFQGHRPVSTFKMSRGGKRYIWSNLPLPETITFDPQHKIREIYGWERSRWFRSFIPYPVARRVADCLEAAISVKR